MYCNVCAGVFAHNVHVIDWKIDRQIDRYDKIRLDWIGLDQIR